MRTLNRQAVLGRVYRHFVIDRQPPGIVGGLISYHQQDASGNECPCAIGLVDPDRDLELSDFSNRTLLQLHTSHGGVLEDVFGVDALSDDDLGFLNDIQGTHDRLALQQYRNCVAPDIFAADMAEGLEQIAGNFRLERPAC